MKNAALLAVSALALSTVTSTAAADQVGVYIAGVQYQADQSGGRALRFGVGIPAISLFNGLGLRVSGDASYLFPLGAADTVSAVTFNPYYGVGLGASLGLGAVAGSAAAGVSLYPNVLAGINFTNTSAFTPFIEASVGPNFALGSSTSTGTGGSLTVGYGLRLGVNYRLR